jgi:hypothetical protein
VWRRCAEFGVLPVETRTIFAPRRRAALAHAAAAAALAVAPAPAPDADDDEAAVAAPLDEIAAPAAGARPARGRLRLWLGLAPAAATLPKPPLDGERARAARAPPWELRLVVWTLHQTEFTTRCPVYATVDVLRAGAGADGSRGAGDGVRPVPWLFDLSFLFGGGGPPRARDAAVDPSNPLAAIDAQLADAYRTPSHPGRRGTGPKKRNLEIHWRVKFRVPVPPPGAPPPAVAPRLRLRTFRAMPWYATDHLLAEAVYDLGPLLAEAARSGARQDVGVQVAKLQPVGRFGTPGRAWVQIALVPETAWANKATAVGLGRAAPNQDPYVPPPTIPNQYTLWERFLQKLPLIGIVCGVLFALALTLVLTASLYIGKVG